ncbi:ROK family protein [Streptosporangium sp. NPDC002524]|uniref:ROK family transcriptional regulator n=1 Tax=Streptosporangium sp. NPDC002524 TaxID=3154537 RepID=UPI00333371DF
MERGSGDTGHVVRALRGAGPLTRQDLMAHTGLTRAQVDQRLEQLRQLDLVEDGSGSVVTGGRRARAISLRRRAGYVLSVALGASGVTVAAVDLSGAIIDDRSQPIDIAAGPHDVLGTCVELCQRVLDEVGGRPWAVGVTVPGPVDLDRGIVVSPPIMPGWDQFPIRDWLGDKLGLAAWLGNDANATALGEYRYGAGKGHRNMVYVKLGSGIGSGIIMGGVLQHGDGGCAGDVGHLPVPGQTLPCRCGNIGCLEAVAGGFALARVAEEIAESGRSGVLTAMRENGPLNAAALARAAEYGDNEALEVLQLAGAQIGEVLAFVVSLLNPSQLVIGGGLSYSGDVLLSSVRKSLYARALPLASRDLLVRRAALGEAGGVQGTAELLYERLFSPLVLEQWSRSGSLSGRPDLTLEPPFL